MHGLGPKDITGPLALFQHRQVTQEDFTKLLVDIDRLTPSPHSESAVTKIATTWWPEFQSKVAHLPEETTPVPVENRSEPEVLNEMIGLLRQMSRVVLAENAPFDGRMERFAQIALLPEAARQLLLTLDQAMSSEEAQSAIAADPDSFHTLVAHKMVRPDGQIQRWAVVALANMRHLTKRTT